MASKSLGYQVYGANINRMTPSHWNVVVKVLRALQGRNIPAVLVMDVKRDNAEIYVPRHMSSDAIGWLNEVRGI